MLGLGPLRPLLVFIVVAFAAISIQLEGTNWRLVGLAALAAASLVLVAAAVPWDRVPAWFLLAPALGTLIVIAILRESEGGANSGFGPLAMLPVVWVALVLGRRAVVTVSLGVGLMFAVPIVCFGAPMYPASGWRSTVLWVVAAGAIGLVVRSVVAERSQQAETAERQSEMVAATLKVLDEVAGVARDISFGVDARERVCAAAVSGTNATLVTIVERANGAFAITGTAGVPIDLPELQQSVQPVASLSAYYSQTRVFIPDVSRDPGVSPLIVESTGLASILYEPIIRHGRPVGVLSVGWSTPRERVDAKDLAVISYLAAEAGSAIERSDLLTRLDMQSRTDDLTAVANRRGWDAELADTIAESTPACVAMIDLDRFKAFNDDRGHLAGDRLLQECASAWKQQIRPGDLIARYGGEEFAVLLRNCSLGDATAVLERVRLATPEGVTCSVGVDERRFPDTPDGLVSRADAALYRAKRNGRNRLAAA